MLCVGVGGGGGKDREIHGKETDNSENDKKSIGLILLNGMKGMRMKKRNVKGREAWESCEDYVSWGGSEACEDYVVWEGWWGCVA